MCIINKSRILNDLEFSSRVLGADDEADYDDHDDDDDDPQNGRNRFGPIVHSLNLK